MNRVAGEPKAPPPSTNGCNGHAPAEGRDAGGRFAKGNKGGPGNPFARRCAELRQALLNSVTEDDIAALAKRLLLQAKGGDMAAAKLLLTYVIGTPAPAADPDRLDRHELELLNSLPKAGLGIMAHMGRVAPALLLELARHAQVADRSLLVERMGHDIRARNESLGALIEPPSDFDKSLEDELQDEGDDDD
jgi:hypothetical protein